MRSVVALAALAALVVSITPVASSAQGEPYLELLRSDVKAETVAILTEVMDLPEKDAEVFWPIYREYELERSKLGDRRIALLKQYAEGFDALTNEKAKELADAHFTLEGDNLKLNKKYFGKVEKALGANTAARFIQVMNQVNLLIDVQIAASMPLIEPVVEEASR